VFVPDYSDGTVAVVDVAAQRVTTTAEPVAPGRFELFAVDGMVFYNDPGSEQAGVIRLDGTFVAVRKYDSAAPEQDVDNPASSRPSPGILGTTTTTTAPDSPPPASGQAPGPTNPGLAPRRGSTSTSTASRPADGPGTTSASTTRSPVCDAWRWWWSTATAVL
jgi:hypothetical protein